MRHHVGWYVLLKGGRPDAPIGFTHALLWPKGFSFHQILRMDPLEILPARTRGLRKIKLKILE